MYFNYGFTIITIVYTNMVHIATSSMPILSTSKLSFIITFFKTLSTVSVEMLTPIKESIKEVELELI